MFDPPLLEVVHLTWQSGVVLSLLFFGILFSKLTKTYPRDLVFTVAALLTGFTGIITSKQIYQSLSSQAILATLGLWMLGKAMQQQGIFSAIVARLSTLKLPGIYLGSALCGALLHHRYFLQTVLRSLLEKKETTSFGYGFCYIFALGGLATAIGVPTNLLFIALYAEIASGVASNLFLFLPFAVLPILLSILFFVLFHRVFDRVLKNKKQLFAFLKPQAGPKPKLWKKGAVIFLFLAAIAATFFGVPIGSAFLCAGIISLILRVAPMRATFRDEFPLPPLLEMFSATLFFFSMLSSGLHVQLANLFPATSVFWILSLFFLLSQLASHTMPRPVAFSILFTVALSVFEGSSAQILFAGTTIAFATALPLFGKPTIEETAAASMISAQPNILVRLVLILILFASTVIPSCLFWPK